MASSVSPLEKEIDAFMELLPSMLKHHKGKFAVFANGKPAGFWDTDQRAFEEGVKKYGNVSMLVREVSKGYQEYGRHGKPVFISRNFLPSSLQSPDGTIYHTAPPVFSEISPLAKNSNYFVTTSENI